VRVCVPGGSRISAQVELLLLPWPEDLLEIEGCGPIWMCKQ
jgi:hypothetical protein